MAKAARSGGFCLRDAESGTVLVPGVTTVLRGQEYDRLTVPMYLLTIFHLNNMSLALSDIN